MDHRFRRGLLHRGAQGVRVERVDDRGRRTRGADRLGALGRARSARHLVPGLDQQRDERTPDRARRPGKEHPHRATERSALIIQPSSTQVTTSEARLAGPSHSG